MASNDHVSDSESSEADAIRTPSKKTEFRESSPPQSVLSHRFRESSQKPSNHHTQEQDSMAEDTIAVVVSAPERPWEYQPFREDATVDTVLQELEGPRGELWYKIGYEDGRVEDVSL